MRLIGGVSVIGGVAFITSAALRRSEAEHAGGIRGHRRSRLHHPGRLLARRRRRMAILVDPVVNAS
jgi:hypothetical protein